MITWPAKVLSHVGELAIVQVPGGLLTIWDRQALLLNGDSTTVLALSTHEAAERGSTSTNNLFTEAFQVYQNLQVAVLVSAQQRIPLLLPRRETLPPTLILAIGTQPAEMAEGTPQGTGLPPDPPICGC